MQRQSLGSPTSKLHIHGAGEEITVASDDREDSKPRRLSFLPWFLTSASKSEKLIHLIPLLTLICFLILYLNSHSPSQSDLEAFNGFKHPSKHLESREIDYVGRFVESREIDYVGRFMEFERGDVLAIPSQRNLKQLNKYAPKSWPHRKIADF